MAYKFDPNDETTNLSDNIFFRSVDTIRKNIGNLGMKTLQIMAFEGISEEPELINTVRNVILFSTGKPVSDDSIRRSIQYLDWNELIQTNEVNTGVRRFKIHRLAPNGYLFANHVFHKEPVESEYNRFIREHASVHHGYLIKDVKKILADKEIYDDISTERSKNFFRIGNGMACIPDVVCKNGKERVYYEVECGTHKQQDFNYKCSKLTALTCKIIIIGQNRKIVGGILKRQVETWIDKEWDALIKKDVEVYLTTISDLKNDKWTYCYNMDSSEPRCNCPIDRNKKGGES